MILQNNRVLLYKNNLHLILDQIKILLTKLKKEL
jgi:hypothetical protein